MKKHKLLVLGCLCTLIPNFLFASSGSNDYFPLVLLAFGVIILSASIGKALADKLGQPAVLGELLIGLLISNLLYYLKVDLSLLIFNIDTLNNYIVTNDSSVLDPILYQTLSGHRIWLPVLSSIFVFSSFGALFLLFAVGVETSPKQFLKVGWNAMVVATIGVVAPGILGFLFCKVVLPDSTLVQDLFISATLCATSVGITARVLKDLKISNLKESKIILGAAVVDDVLGLVILAVCVGLVQTGTISLTDLSSLLIQIIILFSLIFLFGEKLVLRLIKFSRKIFGESLVLILPLIILLLLSFIAMKLGLAGIIGAFLAGLILSNEELIKELKLKEFFEPLEKIFSPIFFVLMGLQVNLSLLFDSKIILISLGLILIAIVGKIISGIFLPKDQNKWLVGIGMIPRGEVGLIFAGIGKSLGVISPSIFSAIVVMVLVTTVITPPLIHMISKKITN